MSKGRSTDAAAGRLQAAVEAGRSAIGTPEQVERLRARVAVGVGEIGSGTTASTATSTGTGRGAGTAASHSPLLGLKAILLVAGVGVIVAAWLTADRAQVDPNPAPTRLGTATTVRSSSQPTAARPAIEPTIAQTALPATQTPPVVAPTAASAANVDPPTSAVRQARPKKPTPATASTPLTATRGESEVELITRAQTLLDSQPTAALTALGEHERLYPSGMLREERETLRIDAEWALGRRSVALSHARAFVQRYPHSTQTRRFDQLLSDHKNETGTTRTE